MNVVVLALAQYPYFVHRYHRKYIIHNILVFTLNFFYVLSTNYSNSEHLKKKTLRVLVVRCTYMKARQHPLRNWVLFCLHIECMCCTLTLHTFNMVVNKTQFRNGCRLAFIYIYTYRISHI